VQRAKSQGDNPVYYVLGQTEAGRYLFCVVIQFPDSRGYPVTARPMTDKEKKREAVVQIHLQPLEVEAVKKVAKSRGIDYTDLIREWVLERVSTA
jgi:hypothetical protein